MTSKLYKAFICAFSALIFCKEATSQTLFSRPDTTPDYASYRHFDECMAAIERLQKLSELSDPSWSDTLDVDTTIYNRRENFTVVLPVQQCLNKRDLDSISAKNVPEYIRALLVANRDEDVQRIILRLQDSIINDYYKTGLLYGVYRALLFARPARIDLAMSLYKEAVLSFPPDSAGLSIGHRTGFAWHLHKIGKHDLFQKLSREIIEIADTVATKYRDEKYINSMKDFIYPVVTSYSLLPEAEDSLAVSTEAYRRYLAGIWTSMVGSKPSEEELGPYGQKPPALIGHYWYSNEKDSIQKVDPFSVLDDSAVTIIYFAQSGCHSYSTRVGESGRQGRESGMASRRTCWGELHRIRKVMEQYPGVKLVVVSNTYGHFSDAPPLTPEQEADTLADYFLGFHKLKGKHIIYKTDFIRLPGSDNRRVDMETENNLAYKYIFSRVPPQFGYVSNVVVLVDELGQIFHVNKLSDERQAAAVNAKLRVVMNRLHNRISDSRR